jgi:hypothetical protein
MNKKAVKAIKRLQIQQKNIWWENRHIEADKILCEFLVSIGYKKIVDEYEKIGKSYK